jgi:phenylalanyl-tRNA synthetase beta chain
MTTMLANNLNRDVLTGRLFEAGAIFSGSAASVNETESLALGLTGAVPATALHSAQDAPFFELKGVVESLLALFNASAPAFAAEPISAAFEPGRAAVVSLDGQRVATFGQLSATEAARRKLRQPVYLAELRLDELFQLPPRHVVARELSRFQAVERDFSFTFAEGTEWKTIAAAIHGLEIPELQSLSAVEVFRDAKKLPGHFSMLVRTIFQSNERTLVEGELAEWSAKVIGALVAIGGVLRS